MAGHSGQFPNFHSRKNSLFRHCRSYSYLIQNQQYKFTLSGSTRQTLRAWVHFYTIGLSNEIRKDRQDEIKSDIWEHLQDLKRENKSSTEIIGRLLRGIPVDIIWRLNQSEGTIAKAFISLPQSCLNVLAMLTIIFFLFPLVTVGLVIALTVVIILGFVIAFPFYYKTGTIILGPWVADTLGEAVIASVIGLALLALVIFLVGVVFRLVRRHLSLRIGRFHLGWSE